MPPPAPRRMLTRQLPAVTAAVTLTAGAPTLTCGGPNPSGLRFTHSCGARPQIASAPAPTAPPEAAAIPTSFAAGRYQVRRFLAEGCKEGVYLAHDILLDRDVAIVLIKTANSDEPDLACPRRKAQAIGRLSAHSYIIIVYDISEEDGQRYFASGYMEGGSVDDLLQVASERQQ
jgi:hypothetical protein